MAPLVTWILQIRAKLSKNPDKGPPTSVMGPSTEPCSEPIKVDQLCHFNTLSDELLLILCENMDAATSTCLGLTCRRLYKAHRRIYGSVCLSTPVEGSNKILRSLIARWIGCWGRGQDYDDVDHIFRSVSYLRTLNLTDRQIRTHRYDWEGLEDPSYGLYVSKCVCKGANGAVTRWQRASEGKLEEREKLLAHRRLYGG
jgi:hypothetical protein